jgi:hypothetical protein
MKEPSCSTKASFSTGHRCSSTAGLAANNSNSHNPRHLQQGQGSKGHKGNNNPCGGTGGSHSKNTANSSHVIARFAFAAATSNGAAAARASSMVIDEKQLQKWGMSKDEDESAVESTSDDPSCKECRKETR